MIILKLKAGLGNQLFEYAYARALALRSNTKLLLDLRWYQNHSEKDTPRTFDLSHYAIVADIATDEVYPIRHNLFFKLYKKALAKCGRFFLGHNDYTYNPRLVQPVSPTKTVLVEGHFNSEKYFKEFSAQIKKELTLKDPLGSQALTVENELKEKIASGKILVLIHVRRGDYVTNIHANSFHGVQTNTYYSNALMELKKRLTETEYSAVEFILASDDLIYLQEEIVPLLQESPYIILSRPGIQNYEEIHLMSLCHHFIIANSSFSWWGAWLSSTAIEQSEKTTLNKTDKIVLAPKRWVSNPRIKTPDILPEDWIAI